VTTASAYAATSPGSGFSATSIDRREPEADDVEIAIDYCGLCHSDVHSIRGEWGKTDYPLVPGHEIVGRVTRVGDRITDYAEGDLVGVGCMVDSCRVCPSCSAGQEQYCEQGMTPTYGGADRRHDDVTTQGGYSSHIVVNQEFVLRVPQTLDPAAAAPLLCAGITTYSPLRHFGVSEGDSVGVVGLGGLGHMTVKLAKAMGAFVTVFTTSAGKSQAAYALGADQVVVSSDDDAMAEAKRSLNLIVDTVAAQHDLNPYLATLKLDGGLVQLGLPSGEMPPVKPSLLIGRRLSYSGSLIGGIRETQEMLDFCAEHAVTSEIEMVKADQLDEAYDRMVAGDVRYRFVLDNSSLNGIVASRNQDAAGTEGITL
jgi:alcohol dehydrogenase (NADP+)